MYDVMFYSCAVISNISNDRSFSVAAVYSNNMSHPLLDVSKSGNIMNKFEYKWKYKIHKLSSCTNAFGGNLISHRSPHTFLLVNIFSASFLCLISWSSKGSSRSLGCNACDTSASYLVNSTTTGTVTQVNEVENMIKINSSPFLALHSPKNLSSATLTAQWCWSIGI